METLYMKCNECGEIFEGIEFAYEHLKEEKVEFDAMQELHPGFDIQPESEAI